MRRLPALLALFLLCACAHLRAAEPVGADPSINQQFRERADYDVWSGRLESESREIFRLRNEIAAASGVERGMRVADVGAGTGLFTMIFAQRVGPGGRVTAVDIAEPFLAAIRKRAAAEGLTNVFTTLGTQTDTGLAQDAFDVVFTSDTYHHFEQVGPVIASIRRALKPGGRFIVIDFQRIPGVTSERTLAHVRAGKEGVVGEVEGAGFRLAREVTDIGLKQNYFLVFEKR